MPHRLQRIIYMSRASADWSDEDLLELLSQCRHHNELVEVSGVLGYHDRSFFQVLEGSAPVIEDLLTRLALDDRHQEILVLEQTEVEERIFGDWSMGWLPKNELQRAGFDPDILRLDNTPSVTINAMLDVFRVVAEVR